MKNKDIILKIIEDSCNNDTTTISNKEIIKIANEQYNKKLYDKTINDALVVLQNNGYITKQTIINNKNYTLTKERTITLQNNKIKQIQNIKKVLDIINNTKSCLTVNEIVEQYCESIIKNDFITYYNITTEQVINNNRKVVVDILAELVKNKKINEHRAVKKLPRNTPKVIKNKVQILTTNTKYYTPKKVYNK